MHRSFSTFRLLATAAACLALVVIVLGAWVRLSAAGLGCPDWPGCYGHLTAEAASRNADAIAQAFPQRPFEYAKALKEMVHRYFASTLGLLILALAGIAVANRKEPQQPVALPVALVGLVVLQGLLGMWTVTLLLKPLIVVLHLLGGMATLSLLVWLAMKPCPLRALPRRTGEGRSPGATQTAATSMSEPVHGAVASSPSQPGDERDSDVYPQVVDGQLPSASTRASVAGASSPSSRAFGATASTISSPAFDDGEQRLAEEDGIGRKGISSSSPPPSHGGGQGGGTLKKLALAGLIVLVVQIALGGWTSSNYAALACPDFPTCQNEWWPDMDFEDGFVLWRGLGIDYEGGVLDHPARVAIHFTHRLGAVIAALVLSCLSLVAWRRGQTKQLRNAGLIVGAVLLVQLILGPWMVVETLPLSLATAHNAVAALLLVAVVRLLRVIDLSLSH